MAASASVPLIFKPLKLGDHYGADIEVQLVDGGVHDNQGIVSLLAMNCNVVLVSDACGQLLFLPKMGRMPVIDLGRYGKRLMDTLMERVRGANFIDLNARKQSGLLREFGYVHMKSGLSGETQLASASQEARGQVVLLVTLCGIRREFQEALARLRPDLDTFSQNEAGP